jgi:hypothetical protein
MRFPCRPNAPDCLDELATTPMEREPGLKDKFCRCIQAFNGYSVALDFNQ